MKVRSEMKYFNLFLLGTALAVLISFNRTTFAFGGEWLFPVIFPFLYGALQQLKKDLED